MSPLRSSLWGHRPPHHMPENSQSERAWDRRKETSDYCRLGPGTARESLNPTGAGRGGQRLHSFFFFLDSKDIPTQSLCGKYTPSFIKCLPPRVVEPVASRLIYDKLSFFFFQSKLH